MIDILRCPIDGSKFVKEWTCEKGHSFREVDGIIDLLQEDVKTERLLEIVAPIYESLWAPLGFTITAGKSYDEIMRLAGSTISGNVVLDVGTGTGKIFDYTKCEICIGLDISYRYLRMLKKKRKNVIAIRGNALKLPVADESVDGVSIMFVLHMLNSPLVAIREIYRVLKHKGKCVATVLTKNNFTSSFLAKWWRVNLYSIDYYMKLFEEVGLKSEYKRMGAWTYFMCAKP